MAKSVHVLTLGLLAAAAAGGPAFADNYTINSYSVPNNTNVTITDTTLGINAEPAGSGGISISVTDSTKNTTSTMTVWCSDISNYLGTPASYTLDTLSSDIGQANYNYLDSTKVNQVNALLTAMSSGLINPVNATTSAALQAAIWEVIYQSGDSGYNVTTGNFFIGADGDNVATVEADANLYLSYVTSGTWLPNTNDTVEQFQPAPFGANDQTLIYLGVNSTGQQQGIPEPGSLGLLASGLVGFAALRRRARA
jgi:hypothetical protein